MGRLTFDGNFCDIAQCRELPCPHGGSCTQRKVWEKLKAYEDLGLEPEEANDAVVGAKLMAKSKLVSAFGVAAERLRELAEADKAGRLMVLPCQSGEHVFALLDDQKHVRECEVKHAVLDGWRKVFYIAPIGNPGNSYSAPFGAFGQTVFLTREEAEEALEAARDG